MARRAKLSSPVAIRWATVVRAGPPLMLNSMVEIVAIPMLKEIGTPRMRRRAKLKMRTRMGTISIFSLYSAAACRADLERLLSVF